MADRYWRGGSGTWDTTSTTNWSTTSGGAGGASVPTSADNVIFDQTGPYTVTLTGALLCLNFTVTGSSTTFSSTGTINVKGNWSIVSGTVCSNTGAISFTTTSTQSITTNGVTVSFPITIAAAAAGTVSLNDSLTSTGVLTLTSGTLSLGTFTFTATQFLSSGTSIRSVAFGTGNLTLTGTGTVYTTGATPSTGYTQTGTPNVYITSTGSTAISVVAASNNTVNSPIFFVTGGTYTLTTFAATTNRIAYIDFTGFSGTWLVSTGTSGVLSYGYKLSSTMTVSGSTSLIIGNTLASPAFNSTLQSSGKTIPFPIVFFSNATSSNPVKLIDALTSTNTVALSNVTTTNGSIDLNGQTLTCLAFSVSAVTTATRSITFNGGTIVVTATSAIAFNNLATTSLTTSAGSGNGIISMTNAAAKTFVGGGATYAAALNQGGAGTLTITGSNTLGDITNTYGTTGATSILFTAGTTTTFGNWSANGTAGKLLTIGSVTAASHTLSKSAGTVSADYLSISRSTATGGASWYAGANSTNGGNNTGWIFTSAPLTKFFNFFAFF